MGKEDVAYMHIAKYYSAIRMRPFMTTWMDLEGITLSEINQRKTNTI